MPAYDDEEKAAVAALLKKYQRIWWDRERDRKLKAAVDERLEKYPAQIDQLRGAFSLFGVTGLQQANWDQLAEDMGIDAFNDAVDAVPKYVTPPELFPAPDEEGDEDAGEREPKEGSGGLLDFSANDGKDDKTPAGGTVREIVLEKLKAAGATGAKAGEIRQYIEALRGHPLHEKTVGMTLYRLSKDGAAIRKGRTWFFVPPSDETKNPGGDTPGLINRDTKEGEEL